MEHNWWVTKLSSEQPSLSPLERFEEARRVVIALVQSITTREYLAALLGKPLPPYRDPVTGKDSYDSSLQVEIDMLFGT